MVISYSINYNTYIKYVVLIIGENTTEIGSTFYAERRIRDAYKTIVNTMCYSLHYKRLKEIKSHCNIKNETNVPKLS